MHERLRMTPVEEKLAQYHLKWFGHIQWTPLDAPVRYRVINQTGNEKRDRGRPNLT
jgi:hypothetical protein